MRCRQRPTCRSACAPACDQCESSRLRSEAAEQSKNAAARRSPNPASPNSPREIIPPRTRLSPSVPQSPAAHKPSVFLAPFAPQCESDFAATPRHRNKRESTNICLRKRAVNGEGEQSLAGNFLGTPISRLAFLRALETQKSLQLTAFHCLHGASAVIYSCASGICEPNCRSIIIAMRRSS